MSARRLPSFAYRLIGLVGNSRVVTRLHPIVYRRLGGRGPLGRNFGVRNVILTTVGRHSGRERDAPVYAFEDGDRLVVVGSRNGADRHPAWVHNLRATPRARVQVGREVRHVLAREAAGEEYDRLWRIASRGYPGYELYRAQTSRRIPVIVLERDMEGAPGPAPRTADGVLG
jgi:deazaflavin-dependent oxidoreductase (nitroreductase family)